MSVDDQDLAVAPAVGTCLLNLPKAATGSRVQGMTLYDQAGGDGNHTFTPVALAAALGALTEGIAATPSASSGLNGLLRLIAQTLLAINSTGSAVDADSDAIVTLNTKTIANGGVSLTPKFFKIDRATNADGAAVVNIVAAKKIRVLAYHLVCAAGVGVKWQSSTSNNTGAGVNTDLTGLETYAANGGIAPPFCPLGLLETAVGEALKLNLNGAQQVSGCGVYVEV